MAISEDPNTTTNFMVIFIIAELQFLTLLFMTVVFEAFSKLTSRHTALVLLFSKELATHILEFYNTFILIAFDLMRLPKSDGFKLPMLYFSTYLYFINYIHVLAMAINRIYAIFYPHKYSTIWSKRGTTYICIVVWILGIALGSHQVVFPPDTTGSTYQASMVDAVQGIVIAGSIIAYVAILVKLAHEKMSTPKVLTETAELARKDRLMLCAVFFTSVIPMALNHALAIGQKTVQADLMTILHYVNGTLLQCLDELILFILCEEFRDRVRQQIAHQRAKFAKFRRFICCQKQQQTAVVTPTMEEQHHTPVEIIHNHRGQRQA